MRLKENYWTAYVTDLTATVQGIHSVQIRLAKQTNGLVWHIFRNALPEITPLPPSTLPIPRIGQIDLVANTRITVHIVKQIRSRLHERSHATSSIQVQQHGLLLVPSWPVDVGTVSTCGWHSAVRNAALRILN